jgi:hypothetical protein
MSFISTLSPQELEVLRTVVKTVNFKHYPKDFCTNYEADKLIDSLAPSRGRSLVAYYVRRGSDTRSHTKRASKDAC